MLERSVGMQSWQKTGCIQSYRVEVVKRLTGKPSGAHQLDDPVGAHPALTNGVCCIAVTHRPAHLATIAVVVIADHQREVPVSTEQGKNLPIQPALVVFDRREQVGVLLGGELKKRWRSVQRTRLDQHTLELKGAEQVLRAQALV